MTPFQSRERVSRSLQVSRSDTGDDMYTSFLSLFHSWKWRRRPFNHSYRALWKRLTSEEEEFERKQQNLSLLQLQL
jgi:hypothetical protein